MSKTLYPYQRLGADFLFARNKALLFDDPGLGKTTQALHALEPGAPLLVVCPASVKLVWKAEIAETLPGYTLSILSGRKSFHFPREKNHAVVINYDCLPKLLDSVVLPQEGTQVVWDEAHYLKTPSTNRSKSARWINQQVLAVRGKTWGLTATPLADNPDDLYGVTYALNLDKEIWKSYRSFFWLFRGYRKAGPYNITRWGKPRDEVPDLLRPYCLGRKRTDVLPQLPTKQYRTITFPVGRVKEADEVAVEELIAPRESAQLSKARAALATAKSADKELHACIQGWLEEGPLVIFSQHVQAAENLARLFGGQALTGGTNGRDREQIIADFKSGAKPLLCGTIGAMGTGLTLTESRRVVFIDRAWIPSDNIQAEDRVCRIGQTRGVEIVDIVASDSTLDGNVFRILKRKTDIIDASIEAAREKNG